MNASLRHALFALVALLLTPPFAAGGRAQGGAAPEEFTAVGDNRLSDAPTISSLAIRIARWSTQAEKEGFARTLLNLGPEALLDELCEARVVGTIQSPQSLPWQLRFAWQERTPDGGRRILILTDRPIDKWEVVLGSPSLAYPFSLIELRLNGDGEGEGRLSVATRVRVDRAHDVIELENYDEAPARLTVVRSRRPT
jgi:hypothetical protein